MAKKLRMDWFLFAIAAALALFGVVMVYSASAMLALKETEGVSQYTYFYKQLLFTAVGLAAMFAISRIDYRNYQRPLIIYGSLLLTVILLISVFGFPTVNGARRWIRFGGFSLQPSEIAKIVLPLFLAYFLTRNEDRIGNIKETVLPCLAVMAIFGGLIIFEPDLGTTIVLCAIFSAVYFTAGAKLLHIAAVLLGLLAVGVSALMFAPWRVERLMAFLDPFAHADDAGYQVVQSLYAIGSGGFLGEGFAKGQQKLFYLPYPHSDFIFAVVGEEFGLIGTLTVVLAFTLLLWRGTRAALLAPDRFGKLLGIGIITGIIVQALFNISVVISILPAKGIPLPFISYGGSSIVITLCAIGVLLNLSQYAGFVDVKVDFVERNYEKSKPRKRRNRTGLK
ncbi:MAG: putative lipid II flippase FtsW [Pyrinomonadaceae bacterium]|nr:putative lipid II flippase FtsW [Pyrinomonadaceae bacterium]